MKIPKHPASPGKEARGQEGVPIGTTTRPHLTPTGAAVMPLLKDGYLGKDVERWEPLCSAGGSVNGSVALENTSAASQEVRHRIIVGPTDT